MSRISVLITGSGSLYGTAVIQQLFKSNLDLKIVACDMNPRTLGVHLAHAAYLVPPASEEKVFLSRLLEIIARENIQAVFVASSHELGFFSCHKAVLELTGAKIFTNSPEVFAVCDDKWQTYLFLKHNGFFAPGTMRFQEDRNRMDGFIKAFGFPLIVKPRQGTGSKGLFKVNSRKELIGALGDKTGMVLQQYLPDEQGEFTAGVCTGAEGRVLSGITLRRYLQNGMTMVAEAEDFSHITAYCQEVARALKPYGPCNFQLRLYEGRPYIFEINPRFSSSTGMRLLLGVNEPEILLRAELLGETVAQPEIPKYTVIRQFADYLVPSERVRELETKGSFHLPVKGNF